MRRRDALLAPLAAGSRRTDGGRWTNPLTGQGGILDRHTRTTWQPPCELDRYTVDGLLRFDGLARRLVWREPYDGTREGFDVVTGDPATSRALARAAGSLPALDNDSGQGSVLQAVGRARAWARAYGGGLIVGLFDDGRDFREPLDTANVRSFRGVRVLDRWEASVVRWNEDTRSMRLGKPEYWQVQISPTSSVFVHDSRTIQMQGVELPPRIMFANQGWGGSQLDLVWGAFLNWQSSLEYMPEFVGLMTQGVFKQKGLADAMIGATGQDAIVRRYQTLRSAMGVLGELAIDAEDEDYQILQRPVAGVAEVFDVLIDAFVAQVDIARIVLLSPTLGGMNSGEHAGEIRGYYDDVAARQIHLYQPAALAMLRWLCMAKDGPTAGRVPPEIAIKWRPLWQPDRAEDDAHELSQAQRRQLDTQVVGASTVALDPALQRLYPGFDPADLVEDPTAPEDDPAGELDPIVEAPQSEIPRDEMLIDARTAGTKIGVGPGTIRRMAVSGQIRAWRVGSGRVKRWRFLMSEIEAAISGRVVGSAP